MNPYHFTDFNEFPGYEAIAHQENTSIQGIIVVHKDSELQTLDELEGATLAFPSPAAFAASLLPQTKLNNSNINNESRYVPSYDLASLEAFSEELLVNPDIEYVRVIDASGAVFSALGKEKHLEKVFHEDLSLESVDDPIFDTSAQITESGIDYGRFVYIAVFTRLTR